MREGAISCKNCRALCCRKGTQTSLFPYERDFLIENGAVLVDLKRPGLPGSGKWHYEFAEDCPFIVPRDDSGVMDGCGIPDSPARPQVCKTFSEGGDYCRELRRNAGLDGRKSTSV